MRAVRLTLTPGPSPQTGEGSSFPLLGERVRVRAVRLTLTPGPSPQAGEGSSFPLLGERVRVRAVRLIPHRQINCIGRYQGDKMGYQKRLRLLIGNNRGRAQPGQYQLIRRRQYQRHRHRLSRGHTPLPVHRPRCYRHHPTATSQRGGDGG